MVKEGDMIQLKKGIWNNTERVKLPKGSQWWVEDIGEFEVELRQPRGGNRKYTVAKWELKGNFQVT